MLKQITRSLALALTLSACSTVMEASRPDPTDLSQFTLSEKRVDVVSKIGPPATTVNDQDRTCDVYKLYTRGVGRVSKGAIIFGEAAADVLTLGLTEVALTPGEAATKNKLHSVLFCYGTNNELQSVTDNGRTVISWDAVPPAAPNTSTPMRAAVSSDAQGVQPVLPH